MKCISGCVFSGLGRSSCRISIQLVQTRILKAFFSLLAECSSLPKVVYVRMEFFFVLTALGTADQHEAEEANPSSRKASSASAPAPDPGRRS